MSGTVQSADGSVVAGAGVTMTNLDFNQAQTAVTDRQGRFRFPALTVGDYELAIAGEGFAPWQQRLRLAVGA
ncbi:MAG TPA: carboxypeptidase-like regulatory domain-containing protein, partial [Thermoanaerobaculia bacterium]|nr:carboxypeptidase-like regulatory domain-containing protein [Thermoanaerobaculia bacterium]